MTAPAALGAWFLLAHNVPWHPFKMPGVTADPSTAARHASSESQSRVREMRALVVVPGACAETHGRNREIEAGACGAGPIGYC